MSKIVNNHHCKILAQTIFALILYSWAYNAHAEFVHGHDRIGPSGEERGSATRQFDGKLHTHGTRQPFMDMRHIGQNRNIDHRHGHGISPNNQTEHNWPEHGRGDRYFHNGKHYHYYHNGSYYNYFYNGAYYLYFVNGKYYNYFY